MKLGFGLYRSLLTEENFRFAKQAGATHIIAHLVDYARDIASSGSLSSARSKDGGLGATANVQGSWTYDDLRSLRRAINAAGLELAGIENFDPAHWSHVLLDGPKKAEQLEELKRLVRDVGRAGISYIGYNFSLAGVWGQTMGPYARGGGLSSKFDLSGCEPPSDTPIPNGMVWNMVYDADPAPGHLQAAPYEEVWARLETFLQELVPVAEEADVRLAAHPDDPPVGYLRQTPRLLISPDKLDDLLAIVASKHNSLELCMGTVQEMPGSDIYAVLEKYSRADNIGYIHCRNVVGRAPNYREAFIDEGEIDIHRAMRILADNGFDGVVIPDHAAEMTCRAPWHAGMAFAMGYIRAAMDAAGVR